MLIDRNIINPDINYDGMNRDDLFKLINRWKRLLRIKYELKKGDVMALGIFDVNHNHVACLFAAAELGLKIFIITKPIARETIHATKMGIFGPVDITISQRFVKDDDLHIEMFERYSRHVCYEDEIDSVTNDGNVENVCLPSDALIFASTSGTTSTSKPVFFSHEETYRIAKRNITAFGYEKQHVIQQTMNMHHASALLTYLIPTLMQCDTHYYGSPAMGPHLLKRIWGAKDFAEECLIGRKVDHVICSNMFFLTFLQVGLSYVNEYSDHRITVNMSGFPATQEIYELAKKYPLDFISHYGSIDTGIPLLINKITKESEYDKDFIGNTVDDFYLIEDNTIECDLWKEIRPLPDPLIKTDKGYYYTGRLEENTELHESLQEQVGDYVIVNDILVLWDKNIALEKFMYVLFKNVVFLNKQDFMVDTKVSMEQLRAYLEHHYG